MPFSFSPLQMEVNALGKNFHFQEEILSFTCRPHFGRATLSSEENKKSQKLSTFQKRAVCPYSLTLLHLERPKLHTILTFLSAVGLIVP